MQHLQEWKPASERPQREGQQAHLKKFKANYNFKDKSSSWKMYGELTLISTHIFIRNSKRSPQELIVCSQEHSTTLESHVAGRALRVVPAGDVFTVLVISLMWVFLAVLVAEYCRSWISLHWWFAETQVCLYLQQTIKRTKHFGQFNNYPGKQSRAAILKMLASA